MIKKECNYRNSKILKGAKCAPCQLCFIEDDTVVAAHSNQYRDGRGMHMKSHDFRVAYLCYKCHNEIDYGNVPKEVRTKLWEEAHRNTIGYMFQQGIVK